MTNETRFDLIMTRLDAWAVGWGVVRDCRDDAANELAYCLENHPDWCDEQLLDVAIDAWLVAE